METSTINEIDYKYNQIHILSSGTAIVALDVKAMKYHIDGRSSKWTDDSKAILLGLYVKRRNIQRALEEFEDITGHKISHSQAYHILFRFEQAQQMFERGPMNMIFKYQSQANSTTTKTIAALDADPSMIAKGYRYVAFKLGVPTSMVSHAVRERSRRAQRMSTPRISEG